MIVWSQFHHLICQSSCFDVHLWTQNVLGCLQNEAQWGRGAAKWSWKWDQFKREKKYKSGCRGSGQSSKSAFFSRFSPTKILTKCPFSRKPEHHFRPLKTEFQLKASLQTKYLVNVDFLFSCFNDESSIKLPSSPSRTFHQNLSVFDHGVQNHHLVDLLQVKPSVFPRTHRRGHQPSNPSFGRAQRIFKVSLTLTIKY